MNFKLPKDREDTCWTLHSIEKMKQYGLSEQRIRRVLRVPKRVEEGVAPNTIAAMQPASYTSKNQTEIWVMYQKLGIVKGVLKKPKIRIISTWRYPGVSPKGRVPEIPEEVWDILGD